jgi:predicted DNA binding CopG/RHH family protein
MVLETDPGRSTACRMPASSTANIRETVDSKGLNYLTLYRKFLQAVY